MKLRLTFCILVCFYVILCWWLLAFECPQHVAVFPWFSPGTDFKTGLNDRNQTCPTWINGIIGLVEDLFCRRKHIFIAEEAIINPEAFPFFPRFLLDCQSLGFCHTPSFHLCNGLVGFLRPASLYYLCPLF